MEYPNLKIELRENVWGIVGPVLCWPDGTALPAQKTLDWHHNIEVPGEITVTFIIGTGFIEAPDAPEINTSGPSTPRRRGTQPSKAHRG